MTLPGVPGPGIVTIIFGARLPGARVRPGRALARARDHLGRPHGRTSRTDDDEAARDRRSGNRSRAGRLRRSRDPLGHPPGPRLVAISDALPRVALGHAALAGDVSARAAPGARRAARAPGRGARRRADFREVQGADGGRRGDQRRGDAAGGQPGRAGDPHLLALQHALRDHHAEPGERRPRAALRAEGLRARRRRRARHAQLVGLLGLRRRGRAAVGRGPRELPRRPAVDERQGRDDRRLLRRHDRHDGRRTRRGRARPRGDRADRGHQPLVRLRLRRRCALLPELGAPHGRGHRHAARVRLRPRAHAADRPDRPALRREAREPREPLRVRRPHRQGLRPHARLRRLLARARLPQGRREHPRRRARRARLAGLQREAGGGRRPLPRAHEHALQAALHVAGRPLDARAPRTGSRCSTASSTTPCSASRTAWTRSRP